MERLNGKARGLGWASLQCQRPRRHSKRLPRNQLEPSLRFAPGSPHDLSQRPSSSSMIVLEALLYIASAGVARVACPDSASSCEAWARHCSQSSGVFRGWKATFPIVQGIGSPGNGSQCVSFNNP